MDENLWYEFTNADGSWFRHGTLEDAILYAFTMMNHEGISLIRKVDLEFVTLALNRSAFGFKNNKSLGFSYLEDDLSDKLYRLQYQLITTKRMIKLKERSDENLGPEAAF